MLVCDVREYVMFCRSLFVRYRRSLEVGVYGLVYAFLMGWSLGSETEGRVIVRVKFEFESRLEVALCLASMTLLRHFFLPPPRHYDKFTILVLI